MMPKKGQEVTIDGLLFDEEIAVSTEIHQKDLTLAERIDKRALQPTIHLNCSVIFPLLLLVFFVSSAREHWAVQAPFMLPAAEALGVEPWKVAMGVAWVVSFGT
ncbi:TIGR00366 family protein [Peribacillus frigoritolerans]|uniref:TIGR00366 family protein n=1 Tax=Peribacillus frigoritolerans TaxID=450367 RepID=UPI003F80AF78